jgi:hypothetical protein
MAPCFRDVVHFEVFRPLCNVWVLRDMDDSVGVDVVSCVGVSSDANVVPGSPVLPDGCGLCDAYAALYVSHVVCRLQDRLVLAHVRFGYAASL